MKATNIKIFFISVALALTLGAFVLPVAQAQNKATPLTAKQRCDEFKKQFTVGSGNNQVSIVQDLPEFCSASQLAKWLIDGSFAFAAITAVFFIINGGYFYLTSAGNDAAAEKAKKMILYSVIGLAVIIMSYAIVRIVGNFLTTG